MRVSQSVSIPAEIWDDMRYYARLTNQTISAMVTNICQEIVNEHREEITQFREIKERMNSKQE